MKTFIDYILNETHDWEYYPPNNDIYLFWDFYGLQYLYTTTNKSKNIKTLFANDKMDLMTQSIKNAMKLCCEELKKRLLENSKITIIETAKNEIEQWIGMPIEEFTYSNSKNKVNIKFIKKFAERYEEILKDESIINYQDIDECQKIFQFINFQEWEKICEGIKTLIQTNSNNLNDLIINIDHVIDLVHSTGNFTDYSLFRNINISSAEAKKVMDEKSKETDITKILQKSSIPEKIWRYIIKNFI